MQRQKGYVVIAIISMLIIATASLASQALTQPKVGGQIVVGLVAEPKVIDPTTGAWHASFVAAQIFDSLLNTDTKLNIVPSLAESWKILENENAYVFNLRKGVTWHDGKPFGPEDVKFSFENIISKYDIFGAAYFKNAKVEILNETAVKLKVEQLLPAVQLTLLASVDTAIVPKHILEGQDFEKSEFRTKPIGTGPFVFKEWVKGSHILLERNPNYWDKGKPYLERIIIRFITDPMTMVSALETGEVNYVFRGLPYEAAAKLGTNPNLEVIAHTRPPYKMTLQINTNHTILKNVDVRRAISYALDRKDIVQKATLGLCIPTYRVLPETVPASPNLAKYDYNIDMANQLLDKAGYPKGADGKRFKIELLTRTGEAEEAAVADLIKDQLAKVGIEVALKRVDFGTMLDLETKYQYDFVLTKRWVEPMWSYQLFHSSWIQPGVAFSNTMLYRNSQVDQLLDSWMREKSPEKQTELLQKLEEILTSELPEIPLYNVVFLNVKSRNIKGTDIPVGRYVFWDPLVNTYIYEETITTPPTTITTVVTTTAPTTTVITTVTTTTATTTTTPPAQPDYTFIVAIGIIILVAVLALLLLRRKR
jgi:peptide/nickel transport system substrate-binding protein